MPQSTPLTPAGRRAMLSRRQLPVDSPISPIALPRAAAVAIAGGAGAERARDAVRGMVGERFGARAVALTDSGTSALVLALRLALPGGGTVALPAYACPDLLAAAVFAGLRVRWYDVDPDTLSPDLDALRATLRRGAGAVVVAHWYGYPADVDAASAVAREAGALVIEDAAQHADARLRGAALGTTGPLTVLSFGRGKGTTAGGGGALMAMTPSWSDAVATWERRSAAAAARGWRALSGATAHWVFGRPALYGIPAAVPALHLGETLYRAAHEPAALSAAAAVLLRPALVASGGVWLERARVAVALEQGIGAAASLTCVRPLPQAEPGYLRLAVLDRGDHQPKPAIGVVRGYPRPLADEPAARGVVQPGEPDMPGARQLCRTLFTLPTHRWVTDGDRALIERWAAIPRSAAA